MCAGYTQVIQVVFVWYLYADFRDHCKPLEKTHDLKLRILEELKPQQKFDCFLNTRYCSKPVCENKAMINDFPKLRLLGYHVTILFRTIVRFARNVQ